MDKIHFILGLAHSGIGTAVLFLNSRAKANTDAAAKETDAAKKAKLTKQAARDAKLAKTLNAADAGITAYLSEE